MPIAAIAAIGAVGSIAGGLIGGHAASQAAQTQSDAANYAANLQKQEADQALAFQKQTYQQGQQNLAPWLSSGTSALANLDSLLGILPQGTPAGTPGAPAGTPGSTAAGPMRPGAPVISGAGRFSPQVGLRGELIGASAPGAGASAPGTGAPSQVNLNSLVNPALGAPGSLSQGWTGQFQAPTNVTEQNDPGFKFRLQQGQDALERSAAAKGGLLTGGTAKDLTNYAQDYASNEYGNVYNRALQQYQQSYNQFQQGQADKYNRLASVSGLGQVTAGQLSDSGAAAAGNIGKILLTTGAQQGQQANNAAAATASGYVGQANAYGGALSGIGGNLSQYALLSSLLNPGTVSSNPGAGA